jgi:type II secretory pathway pseudopilin PulG
MMRNIERKRNKESGFTFMELMAALIVVIILVAVVILVTHGFFTKARSSSLDVDLHDIQTSVSSYATAASIATGRAMWPTSDAGLPLEGQSAPIDFYASFVDENGKVVSFYPHFISKLPRHWDEGVWLIDSAALVSVNMPRDEY